MANPYLILVVVILTVLIICGSVYILIYFQSPEDKNVAWFPKGLTVLGFTLAAFCILMLPLDVANNPSRFGGGGFPMDILWQVVYMVIAGLVVVVIPFAIFYYEAEEAEPGDKTPSQIGSAIKGTIFTLFFFAIITVIAYIFGGIAQVPTIQYSSHLVPVSGGGNFTPVINGTEIFTYNQTRSANYVNLEYRVTFVLYIISMVVFLGYVLFILFGGIGLVAFPLDCIRTFTARPIRITLDEYSRRRKILGERAIALLEIGNEIRDRKRKMKKKRSDRKNLNKFRQSVFLLEQDYNHLQICYKRQGGQILVYWFNLGLGIVSVVLTVAWLLHILLFMLTYPDPFYPFLNNFVIALDSAWGLLGTIAYGIFAFYLLICCIKGNFKFGLRIFIIFPIHPMKVRDTLMNAFLFNVCLVLICAVAITEFCTLAFAYYTTNTVINSFFVVSVRNLRGIKYVFLAYIYAFFIMVFLAAIYFAIRPKEKSATVEQQLRSMRKK